MSREARKQAIKQTKEHLADLKQFDKIAKKLPKLVDKYKGASFTDPSEEKKILDEFQKTARKATELLKRINMPEFIQEIDQIVKDFERVYQERRGKWTMLQESIDLYEYP